MTDNSRRIEELITELLPLVEPGNENGLRPGLQDTPKRVAKMFGEIFNGYGHDGKELLSRTFTDDIVDQYAGMIIVKNIPFTSCCEHHMAFFTGKVWIGYIPEVKVVGLSKLARLVGIYAARLQIQERLTEQITNDIDEYLEPKGVMVVIEATHSCMLSRGVKAHDSTTTTSAVRGVYLDKDAPRAEFLALINR